MGILFLTGAVTLDRVKWILIAVTIIWFVAAVLWMWKNDHVTEEEPTPETPYI